MNSNGCYKGITTSCEANHIIDVKNSQCHECPAGSFSVGGISQQCYTPAPAYIVTLGSAWYALEFLNLS